MLIICPKCFTKFQVDDSLVKKPVQVFKCSQCGQTFQEHFEDQKAHYLNDVNRFARPGDVPLKAESSDFSGKNQTSDGIFTAPSSASDEAETPEIIWRTPPGDIQVDESDVPEEFTPVVAGAVSKGRKTVFLVLAFLIICGVAGAYFWMNKDHLLAQFPAVNKGIHLLTDRENAPADTGGIPNEFDQRVNASMTKEASENDILDSSRAGLDSAPALQPLTGAKPDEGHATDQHISLDQSGHKAAVLTDQSKEGTNKAERKKMVPGSDANNTQSAGVLAEKEFSAGALKEINNEGGVSQTVKDLSGLNPKNKGAPLDETTDEIPIVEEVPLLESGVVDDVQGGNQVVVIKDVVSRYDDTGTDTPRLFVQGIMANMTEQEQAMPVLQAQLYDKDAVLLGVRDLPYTKGKLNPKMAEFFFAEVTPLPNAVVSRVEVRIKGK